MTLLTLKSRKKTIFYQFIILACPSGWTQIDGQCLKLWHEAKTWNDAEKTCIANGGHLATIGTQAQNDWISANAKYTTWHGATDQFSEGKWTEALGQNALQFSDWYQHGTPEPNGGTNENCGAMFIGSSAGCTWCGKWVDVECHHSAYHFVC